MDCPKCGLTNPDTALRCDCGYDFQTGAVSQPDPSSAAGGTEAGQAGASGSRSFKNAAGAGAGAGVIAGILMNTFSGGRLTFWVFFPLYLLFMGGFKGAAWFVAILAFSLTAVLTRLILAGG